MSFTGYARLAERHPDLSDVLEQVRAAFTEMGTAEVVRPDDLASALRADPNQVRSTLDLLAEEDVLVREEMVECTHCEMPILRADYEEALEEEDEYRCTGCDEPLTNRTVRPITTYRCGEKWPEAHPCPTDRSDQASPQAATLDDQAWYTHDRLAEVFGVGKDALRKRLGRYRKANLDGWKENEDRRPRDPQYLYQLKKVKDVIEEMRASSERPAK